MKNITLGMLAHVDAGKTTLTEAMLYTSGMIRSYGRVDFGNTHMDTDEIEKKRGITVFSKQTIIEKNDIVFSLLDTPGHTDLIAEAERVLPVLDYAILVINASDPLQAHTLTIWKLLDRFHIPVFLFITKMDLPNCGKQQLLGILLQKLSENCIDFSSGNHLEEIALRDESLFEQYMSCGDIPAVEVSELIRRRRIFPVLFGSALKLTGISEFLDCLVRYTDESPHDSDFAARVYKIYHDNQNKRLSFLKITGGTLHVRDSITYTALSGESVTEKITELRIYSGSKYSNIQEANSGIVCAACGLSASYCGQGLGSMGQDILSYSEPYMQYTILPCDGTEAPVLYRKLLPIAEENPEMKISWDSHNSSIQIRLMGLIQSDVLQDMIRRRLSIETQISDGTILYKETILSECEGVGHYEPLRHFAEVHLLLKPLARGDGLHFRTECPPDSLDISWQRLIMTHLKEKQHLGVLTGSPITDMEIILKSGMAHIKHTEGGDFRQATYRAVRQGLMSADSVLLEPFCRITLELPQNLIGHAIQDFERMNAQYDSPQLADDGNAVFQATAPAACLQNYESTLRSYSKGKAHLSCMFSHYGICHNQDAVVRSLDYHPESDLDNSPDSIFCDHGAGRLIKWNEVSRYMMLPSVIKHEQSFQTKQHKTSINDAELDAIMEREFGPISRRQYSSAKESSEVPAMSHFYPRMNEHLIIDGYNLLFAIPGLEELAGYNLSHARDRLSDLICSYAGYKGCKTILVFDAYRVKDGRGSREDYNNIRIVYTKENETADSYIERLCHDIGRNESVRVVTSDALIQLSALRAGISRVSSHEFAEDLKATCRLIHSGI